MSVESAHNRHLDENEAVEDALQRTVDMISSEVDTDEGEIPAESHAALASNAVNAEGVDVSMFRYWLMNNGLSTSVETIDSLDGRMTAGELERAIQSESLPEAGAHLVVQRFVSQLKAGGSSKTNDPSRLAYGETMQTAALRQGGLGETHMGVVLNADALREGVRKRVEGLGSSLPPGQDRGDLERYIVEQITQMEEKQDGIVVIKVPRADVMAKNVAGVLKQTRREARRWAASQEAQQYLAALYDWQVDETNEPYMVVEFVPGINGQDLAKDSGGRLNLPVASHAMSQLFAAVNGNSTIGLVHGDIKPENTMFSGGKLRLLDMGLAKFDGDKVEESMEQTMTGTIKGTMAYISPFRYSENSEDRHLDDLFAAAVSAHYWLSGEHAYCETNGDAQSRFMGTLNMRNKLMDNIGWKKFEYGSDLFPDAEDDPVAKQYLRELSNVMTRLLNPAFLKADLYGDGGEDFQKRYKAIVRWFQQRSVFRDIPTDKFIVGEFSPADANVKPAMRTKNEARALAGAVSHAMKDPERHYLASYHSGEQYDWGDQELNEFMDRLVSDLPSDYEDPGAAIRASSATTPTGVYSEHGSSSGGFSIDDQFAADDSNVDETVLHTPEAKKWHQRTSSRILAVSGGIAASVGGIWVALRDPVDADQIASIDDRKAKAALVVPSEDVHQSPPVKPVSLPTIDELRSEMTPVVLEGGYKENVQNIEFANGIIKKWGDHLVGFGMDVKGGGDKMYREITHVRDEKGDTTLFDPATGAQCYHINWLDIYGNQEGANTLIERFVIKYGSHLKPSEMPSTSQRCYYIPYTPEGASETSHYAIITIPGGAYLFVDAEDNSELITSEEALYNRLLKEGIVDHLKIVRFEKAYGPSKEHQITESSPFGRTPLFGERLLRETEGANYELSRLLSLPGSDETFIAGAE